MNKNDENSGIIVLVGLVLFLFAVIIISCVLLPIKQSNAGSSIDLNIKESHIDSNVIKSDKSTLLIKVGYMCTANYYDGKTKSDSFDRLNGIINIYTNDTKPSSDDIDYLKTVISNKYKHTSNSCKIVFPLSYTNLNDISIYNNEFRDKNFKQVDKFLSLIKSQFKGKKYENRKNPIFIHFINICGNKSIQTLIIYTNSKTSVIDDESYLRQKLDKCDKKTNFIAPVVYLDTDDLREVYSNQNESIKTFNSLFMTYDHNYYMLSKLLDMIKAESVTSKIVNVNTTMIDNKKYAVYYTWIYDNLKNLDKYDIPGMKYKVLHGLDIVNKCIIYYSHNTNDLKKLDRMVKYYKLLNLAYSDLYYNKNTNPSNYIRYAKLIINVMDDMTK